MKTNLFKKVLAGTTLTLAMSFAATSADAPYNVLASSMSYDVFSCNEEDTEAILNLNFDDNADDSSSSAVSTTVYGNPAYTNGRIGQAINFATKGQYVDLGDRSEFRFGESTDFTVSFWIKSDKISGDPAIISNKSWNSGSNPGWIVGINSGGNLVWNFKTTDSGRLDTTIPNVVDSQWHHIVVSHDRDGNADFYKDGSLVKSINISDRKGTLDSPYTTKIAQDGTGKYGSTLTAKVDELQIYQKALNEAEVRDMYDNAPPLPSIPVESVSLDQTELNLKAGAPMPLTVTVSPLDATDKEIEWSSSDETVAKVEMVNGRPTILAGKPGDATITVQTVDGGKEASVNVQVSNSFDVDGDGLITKDDLLFILKNLNIREGDKLWERAQSADLNGDKVVDKTDRGIMEVKLAPYMKDYLYKRVVFIGIDGAGVGVKDPQANATHIQKLISEGAGTYEAQAMTPTISGQNWGSMHHGVIPSKHGLDNGNIDQPYPENNPYPSYMKLLKQERPMLKQASFTTWSPINKGIIEDSAGAYKANGSNDTITTQNTVDYIKAQGKNSHNIFVHLDEVDGAGHSYGYGGTKWYEALQKADQRVGQIVQALEDEGLTEDTLIIVTTDHGGIGTGHGGNTPQERTIFWAAKGGSITPGTVLSDLENIDTAAVIARALRLDIPDYWDAKVPEGLFLNK